MVRPDRSQSRTCRLVRATCRAAETASLAPTIPRAAPRLSPELYDPFRSGVPLPSGGPNATADLGSEDGEPPRKWPTYRMGRHSGWESDAAASLRFRFQAMCTSGLAVRATPQPRRVRSGAITRLHAASPACTQRAAQGESSHGHPRPCICRHSRAHCYVFTTKSACDLFEPDADGWRESLLRVLGLRRRVSNSNRRDTKKRLLLLLLALSFSQGTPVLAAGPEASAPKLLTRAELKSAVEKGEKIVGREIKGEDIVAVLTPWI